MSEDSETGHNNTPQERDEISLTTAFLVRYVFIG